MKGFFSSSSGAATVEFALIAPVFICVLAMVLGVSKVQIASVLLERSAYDIAYQLRLARGEGLQGIASAVLERRGNGIFLPEEVKVEAWNAKEIQSIAGGGAAGSGEAASIVHLRLTARLGLFSSLVPEPLQVERSVDFYFMNEPDLEER